MRDLIAELSSDHMVVIDAPPALPVTDAMIMAQRVDGLIVVTFMGKSRKEHLKKVLSFARGVNVRVFGIVLNGIPQGRAAGVYGYETYGYTSDDRRFRKNRRRHRNGGPRPQTAPRVDPDADPLPVFAPSSEPAHAAQQPAHDQGVEAPADDGVEPPDDIETAPPRPPRARSQG
jgi:non-specific protein-tyrosine kinase